MTPIQKLTFSAAIIGASAISMLACGKESCSAEHKPGPAVVTITCSDEAIDAELENERLLVEYSYDGTTWKECRRYIYDEPSGQSLPVTTPVCGTASAQGPRFECGIQTGKFEIRASQNGRSAGPIEIRTRMQDACYYDEDTLYHELTLDL